MICLRKEALLIKVINKNVVIVICSILVIGIIYCFIIKVPQIQGCIFLGKRINIDLTVMLDGEKISLDNLNSNCISEKQSCSVSSKNRIYKTRGGEYGQYSFSLTIPSERLGQNKSDITLNLNYLNTNSWYISESKCDIYLYTNKNTSIIAENAIIDVKYNDDTSQNYNQNIDLKNNSLNINWGHFSAISGEKLVIGEL